MKSEGFFAASYGEARGKFLEAAAGAEASLENHINPAKGPDGQQLITDVARYGPADAEAILVTGSATHGIEGYCGSGCQTGLFRAGIWRELPPGVAMVAIHAINPSGFAWSRRVNEDNIDVNRNFRDHDQPHPENPAYGQVHDMLVPEDWDGQGRADADKRIAEFIAKNGAFAFQAAVSGGQYDRADGLFYGGRQPCWSNLTVHDILRRHTAGAKRVGFIDFHTGLGPWGHGEKISVGPSDSAEFARARDWYGDDITSPEGGTSTSAIVQGTVANAFADAAPAAEFTGLALEYGTLSVPEVLDALRADNWLHLYGKLDSDLGREIKRQIRAAFYGETPDWKESVFDRAVEVVRQAMAALR